jgi:tetratricopeptide (TPR) repeat protein
LADSEQNESPRGTERPALPDGAAVRRPRLRRAPSPLHDSAQETLAQRARQLSPLLLVLAVVGSVLAVGAVHTGVLLLIAATVLAALSLEIYAGLASPGARRPVLSLPACILGALALYCLLQALPLPFALLRFIAPANADVWARALLPFGEVDPPRWASLSLDPGASMVEALRWATYAAVFVTASSVSARRGAGWGVALVFCSAVIAALTTVGHGLAGATKVFGLYQPSLPASSWHIGPLLNPNNLAGYINLGVLAGLGLMLTRRPPIPPWLVGSGVMLLVAVEVTSASRGGLVTLPLGVIVLAVLSRRVIAAGGKRPQLELRTALLLGAAVIGGVALALLGGTRSMWVEIYDKNLSKLEMILWARPLIHDHPIFGVGRGAFESVFPAYRALAGSGTYTHAENFLAQWASEWGLPVTALACGGLGWAFLPGRLGVTRSAVAAGAWVGVLIVLVQNLVDLALEVPGVCIALVLTLGSLWGDGRRRGAPRRRVDERAPSADRAMLAVAATALLGLGLIALADRHRGNDVGSERLSIKRRFEAMGAGATSELKGLRDDLRTAMRRHPAEPYFPLMGALLALRAHDQSPMPWLQHTLERGQVNGRAHLLLAEYLAARGAKKQALFEIRLAAENEPQIAGAAALRLSHWTKDFDELRGAVPEGLGGVRMFDQLAVSYTAKEDAPLSVRCNQEVIARDPSEVGARYRLANLLLLALEDPKDGPALCPDREACRREVTAQADAIAGFKPDSSMVPLLRARLLVVDGKVDDAVTLLETECARVADRVPCLRARVLTALKIPGPSRFNAAAKEMVGSACTSPASCAEIATWVGDIRSGRGETGLALEMYERAARVDPTEARWLTLAESASRAGAHARAAEALQRIALRHGGRDPELARRIEEERSRAATGLIPR